jgi:hypothetical protein
MRESLARDAEEIASAEKVVQLKLQRHNALQDNLQKLCNGNAHEYDPFNGGHLSPPHGMYQCKSVLAYINIFHNQIKTAEQTILKLEEKLGEIPFIPQSPHPMIVLVVTQGALAQRGENNF